MLATAEQLYSFLDLNNISHRTLEHPALFTVEDGLEWHDKIPGLHCKNLFLKDKKDKIWLAILPHDKRADLNKLEKRVGAARLSFGKPPLLLEVLGLTPGSVTPFGLLNDHPKRVTVIIDEDALKPEEVNFHPLRNTASSTIKSVDLLKFIKALGYNPVIVNCGE